MAPILWFALLLAGYVARNGRSGAAALLLPAAV